MNHKTAKIAAFSAAALTMGVFTAPNKAASAATCDASQIVEQQVRKVKFYSNGSDVWGGVDGAGSFGMEHLNGGFVGIDTDSVYGLRNDSTGMTARVAYYPGSATFRMRACRVGLTSQSFTCGSYVEKTTSWSSTVLTSLDINLDGIAASTNGWTDAYVVQGYSVSYGGITAYKDQKGIRAVTSIQSVAPNFLAQLRAGVDDCARKVALEEIGAMCW